MKVFNKLININKNIEKSQEEMKVKKENFNKEWNKWGKKRTASRKLP